MLRPGKGFGAGEALYVLAQETGLANRLGVLAAGSLLLYLVLRGPGDCERLLS